MGVKLRSQQDILDRTPIKKSLEDERNYFATSSLYSSLPQGVLGIESLTLKLTQLLFSHIRTHLPSIVKEVSQKIKDVELQLDEMGPSLPVTDNEK